MSEIEWDSQPITELLNLVRRKFGMDFGPSTIDRFRSAVRMRAEANGFSSDRDYAKWASAESQGISELKTLASELTVPETYFFRYPEQFDLLTQTALPELLKSSFGRPVRILSAGCASGEEPYTAAILLLERFPKLPSVHIIGIDLNPNLISLAKAALYSDWSLRDTPPLLRDRYFDQIGRKYQLKDRVRALVHFEERNLVVPDPDFWRPGSVDAIFCRNVLIYLSEEARISVIDRFSECLNPGGFLFLGTAETLRGISQDFSIEHHAGAFYFRRKSGPHKTLSQSAETAMPTPSFPPPQVLQADYSWVDLIRKSTNHIERLAAGPEPAGSASPPPLSRNSTEKNQALEFLRQERFEEGIRALSGTTGKHRADEDTQVLQAVLLLNSGRIREAQELCRTLLSENALNPFTHFLLSLCREQQGSAEEAIREEELASYLDPDFAMAQVHLGLLQKRQGHYRAAARKFREACALLLKEDPARILLFGGGLSRNALIALCQAEARLCEEAA